MNLFQLIFGKTFTSFVNALIDMYHHNNNNNEEDEKIDDSGYESNDE